ncbi:alpha/beta hydrolase-fold protein [Pararoseomonas sp. SCSIO 73927]|uniref:alpha/beta hydrolase n=1 Tax=Pararoseomonas sp. SCSIO 73927 TaxID=3114537 RepID=UPI0030D1E0B4
MHRRLLFAPLAAALAAPALSRAQNALPSLIPGTTQRDLESRTGQPFRLFLHVPAGEPPTGGWPMITVLDANAVMGLVVDTIRVQAFWPADSGFRSAAVVAGIGYRTDAPFDFLRRSFDLSPPPGRQLPPLPDGRPGARTGGADELLDFIEETVKPLVARAAPIDPARHAVLGHSFGGLFVLHALLNRPGTFRDHIAGSPSIWWENSAILGAADRFAARAERPAPLRLLMTVGEYEQSPAPWHGAARRPRLEANHMVDSARALADRLRPLSGLEVTFEELPRETHMSALPLVVQRGAGFVLRGSPVAQPG